MIRIDQKIAAHVDAALAAGFTVYSLPAEVRPAGFVAVCLEEDGPFAHIQVPSLALEPVSLDVPIKPHTDYGSGVMVDHDGTPEDAVRALRQACSEPMVTVRFMRFKRGVEKIAPVVPNHGRKTIERWPGSTEFVKLGQRGTNWEVKVQARRLEVGDVFVFAEDIGGQGEHLTVESRQYGHNVVILTADEADHIIELTEYTTVTLIKDVSE